MANIFELPKINKSTEQTEEQMIQGLSDFAKTLKHYYDQLIEAKFDKPTATKLVSEFQGLLISSANSKKEK